MWKKEEEGGEEGEEDEDWEGEETQEVKEEKGKQLEEKMSFLWHESLPDQSLWGRIRSFCCVERHCNRKQLMQIHTHAHADAR